MGSIADHQNEDIATDGAPPSKSSSIDDQLSYVKTLVSPSEVLIPYTVDYVANTQPWSIAKDEKPKLCLRPTSLGSLSRIVKHLATTHLDFAVRSQGYGSASAKDVLISLSAFDKFEWSPEEETVLLGAGANWKVYYDEMDKAAPGYSIVAARTPSIGVGGSTLASGFSWLSSEFGAVSDEANMLDAQVVLLDGTVTWLKGKHDDLLWSLRGTQNGFAIVTAFKFRARKYPQQGKIWGGPILIPRQKVREVAKGIMSMVERSSSIDPKVAMFLYVMRKELLAFIGADSDMLVVHSFDALGEEHGRKEFAWALEMEGAVDQTRGGMTLRDVAMLQEHIGDLRGTASNYWQPLALTTLTEEIILNAFKWWDSMLAEDNTVRDQGYLLFELFSCRDSLTGRGSSAWPRPKGYNQMVLLGAGCAPDAPKEDLELARKYVLDGPERIFGKGVDMDCIPNAVEDFHDVSRIYGPLGHYERLKEIKRRYDSKDRLRGLIKP